MTRKRGGSYVWVTWMSKLMAGEVQCPWAPWFRTHYTGYRRAPADLQLAQWQAEHTQALLEFAARREAVGDTTYRENQNQFQLRWSSSLVVAGKPDLVAIHPDGRVTVYDVKTGQQRQSDLIQVMLYMLCLPAASPIYRGKVLSGCVVYRDDDRTPIPPEAIGPAFRQNARYFLDLMAADTAPKRRPAVHECRYCDITLADCPEKREGPWEENEQDIPLLEW